MPRLSIARARLIRSLHRKKERREEGAFLLEGERLVEELAGSPARVRFLFATADRIAWLQERFPEAEIAEVEGDAARLFATEHAQGVGAVVELPPERSGEEILEQEGAILYLDRITDPGNAGTILRTAEWFGLAGVLTSPSSVDLYNPKTVRATMGAILRLPVAEEVELDTVLASQRPLVALDGCARATLGRIDLPSNGVYVVGSEAHGVAEEILERAMSVAIPRGGDGESLNAAIAASILCYELRRGA